MTTVSDLSLEPVSKTIKMIRRVKKKLKNKNG
jgi:hypothetical protein